MRLARKLTFRKSGSVAFSLWISWLVKVVTKGRIIFSAALTSVMLGMHWNAVLGTLNLWYGPANMYLSAPYNARTSSASCLCSNRCKF